MWQVARRAVLSALILLAVVAIETLQSTAGTIGVTVGPASFSAGADNVAVTLDFTSITLTPGAPLTAGVQDGNFFAGDSDGLNQAFPFDLSRLVTIDGSTQLVSQPAELTITPTVDTLSLFAGPTTKFFLPGGEEVIFAFGSVGPLEATIVGTNIPFTVDATFAVPEPASLLMFGSGLLALGFVLRRKMPKREPKA